MTSLYHRKFEMSQTFLIYIDLYLMGFILSILVLRLQLKEMFLFFKKGINTVFNEPHILN